MISLLQVAPQVDYLLCVKNQIITQNLLGKNIPERLRFSSGDQGHGDLDSEYHAEVNSELFNSVPIPSWTVGMPPKNNQLVQVSKEVRKQREEQSKRDKALALVPYKQAKGRSILKMGSKQKYFSQFSNSETSAYLSMVLRPFSSKPVRGPSDFYLPTSLLSYKYEQDVTFGTTSGSILVLPQCFSQQGVADSFAWVNVNNTVPGNLLTFSPAVFALPNSVFLHPLAGGDFVQNTPTNYFSGDPSTTGTGRWSSARLVSCGVRLIPTANITVRSGMLSAGIIPGKTLPATTTSIRIPTPSTLRQYPTSYEVALANVGESGTDLVWLPLDPVDMIFCQQFDKTIALSRVDTETVMTFYRNPMWLVFTGISAQDTYRLEVTTTVEFVPTMSFDPWSPATTSPLKTTDVIPMLHDMTTSNIFEAVTGLLGKQLMGSGFTGQILNKTVGYIGNALTNG